MDTGRAVCDGQLSARDVVQAALLRVAEVDDWLRAFVALTEVEALQAAGELDDRVRAGLSVPPLAGVPIAVKGRAGLRSMQTRRLQAAGAIPIGLTSTPRGPGAQTWGSTARGPTRNPWRSDRSPGGSSAGSAAAVAAGLVPLATGSDGAGSTRIPAAWCGIFGYKPTNGLLPGGDRAGLSVPAPLARHPADLAGWAEAVLGPLPAAAALQMATWSVDLGYAGGHLDDEVATVCRTAANALVDKLGLRWSAQDVALADPGCAWSTLREPDSSEAAVASAHRRRAENNRRLAVVFTAADLLLTPTTPGPAHGHDGPGEHMSVALTWAFNLSGHPAITVPAGRTAAGTPVGLQVVARRRADRELLALARQLPPAQLAPASVRMPSTPILHEACSGGGSRALAGLFTSGGFSCCIGC